MKINMNDHYHTFENMDIGDVFSMNGAIYMRIDTITDIVNNTWNVICLNNGVLGALDNDDNVIFFPDAELSLGW